MPRRDFYCLLLFWLLATLLNLGKAFHIDDSFHLEVAQWIGQHPLQPMSGKVNWWSSAEPIYTFNQPPLYFYLLAVWGGLFGYHEIPLHLLQAGFTFIAIYFFYKLAALYHPRHALLLTAFLALGPAFLVNQNLMVDVPVLSLSILFFYMLLSPGLHPEWKRFLLAGLVLSATLLIKYTLLPLLPVLFLAVLLKRQYRLLPLAMVPVLVLAGWSVFNWVEFSGIHIAGRSTGNFSFQKVLAKAISFLITLGAVSPFALAFLGAYLKTKNRHLWRFLIFLLLLLLPLVYFSVQQGVVVQTPSFLLWIAFLAAGLSFGAVVFLALPYRKLCYARMLLLLWFASVGAFIVLFAPFMATRHVLLVLPPLLLLGAPLLQEVRKKVNTVAFAGTAALGLLLAVSDWVYADFYRKAAVTAMQQVPVGSTVWTAGHWGWQWYSWQAGMQQYDYSHSQPKPGDYFIIPADASRQMIRETVKLEEVAEIVPEPTWLTFASTARFASFYNTDITRVPWSFTREPVDRIRIFRVAAAE